MVRKLIGGAVVGVLHFVLSQLLALAYLLLAAVFGWHVSGYHEPAEYEWWSLTLFVVWAAGFVVAVCWGAFRFPARPESLTIRAP